MNIILCIHDGAGDCFLHMQHMHPDTTVLKETVDELVKRFHAQLDYAPRILWYNRDKGVSLEIPTAMLKLGHDVK